MLDTLRRAGVRTPRQCGCASWDEVGAFVRSLRMSHFRLVLKPDAKAAALDAPGVALCTSMQQAMDGFSAFRERDAGAAVCVQEYLPGADFFVDVVSCGGEHKCVALWVQAPRFVGAEEAAVPPALRLLETRTGEAEEALLELAVDALKALGVAYGPSQVQLRAALEGEDYGAAARSAMVVDVTCAFHGGGADIHHAAKLGVGYSQISACVDLALAHGAGLEAFPTPFTLLPSRPIRLHRHAAEVPMPKPTAAAVDNTLVLSVLRALPSFVSVDQGEPSPDGSFVSEEDEAIGCVYLAHREKVQLDRDIARVAELEMAA
mmetsp:Transcript_20228/g.61404  ORF Transcript_20228/g.61404 Transcript_20228/m.61404 type:complete len:319 (-) Transcript_20228:178-1134(-)